MISRSYSYIDIKRSRFIQNKRIGIRMCRRSFWRLVDTLVIGIYLLLIFNTPLTHAACIFYSLNFRQIDRFNVHYIKCPIRKIVDFITHSNLLLFNIPYRTEACVIKADKISDLEAIKRERSTID
jgi:hypothetical protein